jgi:hypothetical protein
VRKLMDRPAEYYSAAVNTLETLSTEAIPYVTEEISIREMCTGMILDENLRSPAGLLLVTRNQKISYPLLVRVRSLYQKSSIPARIRVRVPQQEKVPSLQTTE